MENLKNYILNINTYIRNYNIYDEYVYLEILCLNTIFHDNDRMEEVIEIIKSEENESNVNFYYKNKIQYLDCYFHNIHNFENKINRKINYNKNNNNKDIIDR